VSGLDREAARRRCDQATEGEWFSNQVLAAPDQATIRVMRTNQR
jgi:hypothetical protein